MINGARATNNNFRLDGVDNNESQFGQIAIYPQPDFVSEFKVESSVPTAESGRAGGGVISVTTKSGGNDVHGTVGEIYQGRFLSAAAARFDDNPANIVGGVPRESPNYVTHNYFGTVGGPRFFRECRKVVVLSIMDGTDRFSSSLLMDNATALQFLAEAKTP